MNLNDARAAQAAQLTEAAKKTLRVLAERRSVPTPEAFAEVYHEVNGGVAPASPLGALRAALRELSRGNRITAPETNAIVQMARRGDWAAVQAALESSLERGALPAAAASGWPQTTLALFKGADALHANWTRARKLEAIARVIAIAAGDADVALERLRRLIESWGPPLASVAPTRTEAPPAAPAAEVPPPAKAAERYIDPALPQKLEKEQARARAWQQIATRAVGMLEHACGESSPAAARLRAFAGETADEAAVESLLPRFVDAVTVIDRQIEDERRVRTGLQRLLRLLCDNMQSLAPDEIWLAGQLEPIRLLLDGPLTLTEVNDAEAKLAQVVDGQTAARRGLVDAKVALRQMLSTLIERISLMGDSAGRFHDQIGGYRKQIEEAGDLESMSRVVGALLDDTESMRSSLQVSRDDLEGARRKVEMYEARIGNLERELAQVASLAQKDPLTQALNRRGLDEAFGIESARARRHGTPLAAVMIDLDDFKKLNDSAGHVAGDRALLHVVQTLRASLRPMDLLARIGGEEFCVLLPATGVADAVRAVERGLHLLATSPLRFEGTEHKLTFSGGASGWRSGESLNALLKRADQALYAAKRAGKNRVLKEQ